MIEEFLIKRSINNDREAHKLIYETCAPYLYAIVKNYVSDKEFIKDNLQEVFASIFQSMHKYDSKKSSFKTWITNICIYTCIGFLKRRNKVSLSAEEFKEIYEPIDLSFEKLNELKRENIENYLAGMPIGYRTVFLLYYIDEYPHKEIAELLDVAEGTSRSQLNRAIKWMHENVITNKKSFLNELA